MQRVRTDNEPASSYGWLSSTGAAIRLFLSALSRRSFSQFSSEEFHYHLRWLALGGLALITWTAIFIACALATQTVLELRRFGAEDLAGAAIAIGLLRELGPLTVSLAWCARTAAFVSCSKREQFQYADQANNGLLPLICAIYVSGALLSVYGLVIGFVAAALYAPFLGVSSSTDFLEAARSQISNKDVCIYFLKLNAANPTAAILAACAAASERNLTLPFIAASAVGTTFILGTFFNLVITLIAYLN